MKWGLTIYWSVEYPVIYKYKKIRILFLIITTTINRFQEFYYYKEKTILFGIYKISIKIKKYIDENKI